MQLIFHPIDLRLQHTFTIAHDSRDIQPTLIVELKDEEVSGFGEATSNPYYGITIENMTEALSGIQGIIAQGNFQSAHELQDLVKPFLKHNSFAQCALDVAAHDFFAKKKGQKLYESWGLSTDHNPLTNYTIGIDRVDKMVEKMKERPWPIYKIKLGTADDLQIVRELRASTDALFRVDANCAWTAEQTLQFAPELQKLGVEFIEQPLAADDIAGMKKIYGHCPLPIIADESCILEADVKACYGLFDGVNIKLTKCGGLTTALRMITEARHLGMKTMVGCMTESSIGISAIAHLLPLLDYVDMDGSLLLAEDPAAGVTFDYGKVLYADQNGTGAYLK
ncbi:L-alanine-DL-glutamate epimerase-like enolase superfamily enzyme [Dyadobacter jejuensis]|uniref:Dipeptide epimerase n=1 Tax=Dyadobacter jejuensis TaxID=1082580 RepID=A0A316A8C4_9BACT|nr:dipeptide epimerase [Dyadobacter jejuensis]PWJ53220.1 L-alanine-DL-glutamate epimerase-like enolase superfamily enzyme [Dyadobacter jejuensis]